MKKLLNILATTGIVASTSATVIACQSNKIEASENSTISKNGGEVSVSIKLSSQKKDDEKFEVTSDKGGNTDLMIHSPMIKSHEKKEYSVSIELRDERKWLPLEKAEEKITIKLGDKEIGNITIKINEWIVIRLNEIKVTDLGDIKNKGNIPSEETVLNAFIKANNEVLESLQLTKKDVEIIKIMSKSATIGARTDDKRFMGEKAVTYENT